MEDLTRRFAHAANLVPSSMNAAGDAPGADPSLPMTAPGSPDGLRGFPLPVDTNPEPLPLNNPIRPWELAAPGARPGSAEWQDPPAGDGPWDDVPAYSEPDWLPHPSGLVQ